MIDTLPVQERPESPASGAQRFGVATGLFLLALFAHEGVRHAEFLHYDDDIFITNNPHVAQGLTPAALRWAFEADLLYDSPNADYWAPMTVISRLVDVQLFGMDPTGHHAMNLLLHAVNVVLVFSLFHMLTGAVWRSAFVAAVLAVHPLHVESVAWLTERKDVLSGLFWWLTVFAYVRFVRGKSGGRLGVLIACFLCGLMSKPMLITLPFALLLLDVWPLRRIHLGAELVREKALLFLIAGAAVGISLATTSDLGASLQTLPLSARLANVVDGYGSYLRQTFWPTGLAVGYPHSGQAFSALRLILGLIAFVGVSAAAIRARARMPYLIVGWFWFLGILVPVVGLVQVGVHGHADRYVYIPLSGISVAVAWTGVAWAGASRTRRRGLAIAALAVILAWIAITRRQVSYWMNDRALFSHALEVVPGNVIARTGLAGALERQGDRAGAETLYRDALRLRPGLALVARNLSSLLIGGGDFDAAGEVLLQALKDVPASHGLGRSEVHVALGRLRAQQGRAEEAKIHYGNALQDDAQQWAALYNWGNLLAAEGRYAEAEARYVEARRLNLDSIQIVNNLGLAQLLQRRIGPSVQTLSEGARRFPTNPLLRTSLGRALLASGDHAAANRQLEQAIRLGPQFSDAHFQLGEALRANGNTENAVAQYREALRLDPNHADARSALATLQAPPNDWPTNSPAE